MSEQTAHYKPLRPLYDLQNNFTQKDLMARWIAETGQSSSTFYRRLTTPELSEYVLFSHVLDIPLEELLGREPFPKPVAEIALAKALGLSAPASQQQLANAI